MAKRVDVPVVIEERQAFSANRFDITSYTVSAETMTASIFARASHEEGIGNILDSRMRTFGVDAAGVQQRLMPTAGRITVLGVLAALKVDPAVIAAVTAGLDAHPEIGGAGYYEGTKQALYAEVPERN